MKLSKSVFIGKERYGPRNLAFLLLPGKHWSSHLMSLRLSFHIRKKWDNCAEPHRSKEKSFRNYKAQKIIKYGYYYDSIMSLS